MIKVTEIDKGKRLDLFLSEKYPEISRSKIKEKIEAKKIFLNGKSIKASYKLIEDDEIEVTDNFFKEEKIEIKPQDLKLDKVYEDEYLLIVNKIAGMVVHISNDTLEDTLVNALLYHYGKDNLSDIGGELRPGIVHRLDKDTSGLIIVAKDNETHKKLARDLQNFLIKREYVFICNGRFEKDEFIIKNRIGRNPKNRLKMSITEDGKYAETKFQKIQEFDNYTFARAILKTGRTHQIRVQLANINNPVVGDKVYSDRKNDYNKMLLHSNKIGFMHPKSGEYLEFIVKEPVYFEKFMNFRFTI